MNSMQKPKPQSRAYVLFILVVVYTFNFIDRQIVGILAIPIKADLGLTDSQLGLMGGLAFALFYTGLGIPVAMLADRFSRTWIMTVALTVWSAMTAASGLETRCKSSPRLSAPNTLVLKCGGPAPHRRRPRWGRATRESSRSNPSAASLPASLWKKRLSRWS